MGLCIPFCPDLSVLCLPVALVAFGLGWDVDEVGVDHELCPHLVLMPGMPYCVPVWYALSVLPWFGMACVDIG